MKTLRKMMALALAMVMVLAMSVSVFASGDTGTTGGDGGTTGGDAPAAATYSITVTNDNDAMSIIGKTYTAYKLFDVTYDGTNYAYSIKTNNPFYSTAAAKTVLDTYFDFTDTSDATVKTVTVKTAKQDATTKTLEPWQMLFSLMQQELELVLLLLLLKPQKLILQKLVTIS